MKDREWYVEQINNLQDWLLDEKIIKAENDIEKQAYYSVLHKIIDVFDGEDKDDDHWNNLLEVFSEL
jgi:hypothetical protein